MCLSLARARESVGDRADDDDEQRHRDESLDERVTGLLESTPKREATNHQIEGSARTRDFQPPFGGGDGINSGLKSDSPSADSTLQWRPTWSARGCSSARSDNSRNRNAVSR